MNCWSLKIDTFVVSNGPALCGSSDLEETALTLFDGVR
jgi:hypothetical protein